ncbi:MAG: PhzF family phenazine biosynthesis protein, partial [Alphaproteobacteria bacterium]
MKLPLFLIDAFTTRPFAGNPAAVVPLEVPLPDAVMQAMAAEHNLSETAFVMRECTGWRLRWFTPKAEVEMCGHATLATAFVLARELKQTPPFTFHTLSGPLLVEADGPRFILDFPARLSEPAAAPAGLTSALGATPREVHRARDWICVMDSAEQVVAFVPDHAALAALPGSERV